MYHPSTHGNIGYSLFSYFHNKELDELYFATAFKFLAGSLINIFIPIYLLNLGYGIGHIALFFMVRALWVIIFYFLGAWSNERIGMKKTIAIGIVASFFFYVSLAQIPNGLYFLIPPALDALSGAFFWTGRQLEFGQISKSKDTGKAFSIFRASTVLVAAIGPVTGAFIISVYSFNTLLLVAAVILILAPIPLFLTPDDKYKESSLSPRDLLKTTPLRHGLVHAAWGFSTMVGAIAWPLFIYFAREEIFDLGIIISATSLLMVFYELYVGRIADKKPWWLFKVGSVHHGIAYFIRPFLITPMTLFIGNLYGHASGSAQSIAYIKFYYDKQREAFSALTYIVAREIWLNLGRFGFLVLLFFIPDLRVSLILAGIVSFAMIYFQKIVGIKEDTPLS